MAKSNHSRIGEALEQLKDGLRPFVERELKSVYNDTWQETVRPLIRHRGAVKNASQAPVQEVHWDTHKLLAVMWDQWNTVFRHTLGPAERSLVSELREVRNRWAHQKLFSSDDSYRALDTIERLLTAVSAPQVREVEKQRMALLRVRFDEQRRGEMRQRYAAATEGKPQTGLKPWRQVVTPHRDVASGNYQQAETIISYHELVRIEKQKLQRGMNYRCSKEHSVFLTSTRPDAPYDNEIAEDDRILIHEGHDSDKRYSKNPKKDDQPRFFPSGKLTQNGIFEKAALEFKNNKREAEIVRVYEKIKVGSWSFRGVFKLIDCYQKQVDGRTVFKFVLQLTDEKIEEIEKLKVSKEPTQL
ncbi:hypothetical protein NKDENANG_02850 [Candidatus Entotheonellaceae bacterium PAL068K]